MKIIGLMLTWNNLEFFRCALGQALDFCDELILVEGCHSQKFPKRSTDGTCEFIESIKGLPKLLVADFAHKYDKYDKTQLLIRRDYPKMSRYYKPGNWIFHWDDDFFLFENDLAKLKDIMQSTKRDSLNFRCRHFFFNFRFNMLQWSGIYCYRIIDDFKLRGISDPYYGNGKKFSILNLDDIVGLHYGYVKKPKRMEARWIMSVEKGTKASKGRFEKWMNISWDKEEDIFNSPLKEIRHAEGLNIYKGSHPKILANHSWRFVEDVRRVK